MPYDIPNVLTDSQDTTGDKQVNRKSENETKSGWLVVFFHNIYGFKSGFPKLTGEVGFLRASNSNDLFLMLAGFDDNDDAVLYMYRVMYNS